jgi:hypothetical protein
MWEILRDNLLSRVFGDGLGADLAARGTTYLADEVRRSSDRTPERLTGVRLRPGESFTVIARPPATREQRKLAAAKKHLLERDEHLSRPSRKQLKAARSLHKRQRRLDRRKPGTSRAARAEAKEARAAARFDQVMAPTKRHAKVLAALADTSSRLDASRDESMREVQAHTRRRVPRRDRVRVYD